jgi:hypothetical protein
MRSSGSWRRGATTVNLMRNSSLERRLFWLGVGLAATGTLAAWVFFGSNAGWSFMAGSALAGGNMLWLRSSIGSLLLRDPKRSKIQVLGGYFLRLMLIPLCLYVMIRFLFLNVIAAVAGLAVLVCSVFIEGILEAFSRSPK